MKATIVKAHKNTRKYQMILCMICFMFSNLQSFGQTLVFDGNYKLTNDMNITVDSIIGNGHTLYLHCGAKLTIRKYAGRITFGTMRYTYERCDPSNEIEVLEGARLFKVTSCEFINITGAVKQDNPNKGGGKTKTKNTRQ